MLADQHVDAAVLTSPASLAWLFNIRGGDVIRSPLPIGQSILRADGSARLFLDQAKISHELPAWLGDQVSLEPPEALASALAELAGKRVSVDPSLTSAWYFDQLAAAGAEAVKAADPTALPRACKNEVEIEGARSAHHRDGAALSRFLHWLATDAQTALPDEVAVVQKLESFREATGALKDLSFDTIAGAGPHGAVVHYRPTARLNRRTEANSLLLVDSGAQYLDGTTYDVTRTRWPSAKASPEMRQRFTLVLKGHLALARVRFPAGTAGSAIDVLARAPLWSAGLDYDHGTGHGVEQLSGRVPRGPQPDLQGAQHRRPAGRDDRLQRARLLQGRRLRHPHREPAEWSRPAQLRSCRRRAADAGFRDPDPGPHRPQPDRADPLLTAEELNQLNAYHARVIAEIGPLVDETTRNTWLAGGVAGPIG